MLRAASSGGLRSGWINGSTFHITTSSIPVVSGDDVVINLSLGDKAACGAAALTCSATANFGDTLSFPIGTPVFKAGWTVNSVDGSI